MLLSQKIDLYIIKTFKIKILSKAGYKFKKLMKRNMEKGIVMEQTGDFSLPNICSHMKYRKYIWFDQNQIIFLRTWMEYFIKENVYIDGFVTDVSECIDVYVYNKKIFCVNEIDWENSVIFSKEELKKYPKIQSIILDDNMDKYIMDSKVFVDEKECFAIQNVGWMREIVKDKPIFVHGFSDRSKRIAEIYELLDFHIAGYIDDELYGEQKEKIIAVEELVYEDSFFVLMDREYYRHNIKKLADLGVFMFENLAIDNPFGTWYLGIGRQILDINLGHSFVGKQGICGFEILGSSDDNAYSIAILGGSTTDGTLFPFKSWPEALMEKIGNLNVRIYNGGVVGYTSTQELVKLLRDVLNLTPDMVIVYDGFNDMAASAEKNPFAFSDIQRAMDYADDNKDKIWLDVFAEGVAPYTGIQPNADKFDIWLNNIKRMRVICENEGISFFAFHQPILYSKLNMTKEEKGLLWSTWRVNDCYVWANEFRSRIKPIADTYEYIYDLSDIFDNETDIYMEDCHVYEKGNRIIADSIYEIISDKLYHVFHG